MSGYFVHPSAEVDNTAIIGDGTKIWNQAQVRNDTQIGKDCVISKNVYIDEHVNIGDRVKVQNNVNVYHGVTIEDDVFVGPSVTFTNDLYPRAFNREWKISDTLVKKGASIGANSTIICGIVIGEYATIGSGSVVTKDVKPHALMVGNPSHQIGWVCKCGFRIDENGVCEECGKSYKLEDWN